MGKVARPVWGLNLVPDDRKAAERLEPFGRVRRAMIRRWNARVPFARRTYIQQDGVDFDPRLLDLKPRGTLYLEGYWQSEDYFKDVEPTIRQDLRIRPPSDAINQELAGRIREHAAVAIHDRYHVRVFDDLQKAAIFAPTDYYQRAVAEMERRVPDAHYYLFSDRPEAARARIPLPDGRITTVDHNRGDEAAYADLWLMSQCRHFIIANSTFSWWGAWLSSHPDKHVIAPGFEMREGIMSWGFRGLLPERWVKV